MEEVESIIYNLANNIDIVNTNKKIEQYKRDNREQILKSKGKLGREEYELEELIEFEKQQQEQRKQDIVIQETESKKKKIREKEALIDELMFSTENAKNIVETFAQQAKETKEEEAKAPPTKKTHFSTGIKIGRQTQSPFLPVPAEEGPLFVFKPLTLQVDGPRLPTEDEVLTKGYTNHVRSVTEQEKAGGFRSNIACMRALQDAFSGLYHAKKPFTV